MPTLLQLPNELKVAIIDELIAENQTPSGIFNHGFLEFLASISRSCRWFHQHVNPILYGGAVERHPYLLCWATETGNIGCMKRLLEAGADPNAALRRSGSYPRGRPTQSPRNYTSLAEFFRLRYSRYILCNCEISEKQGPATHDVLWCEVHHDLEYTRSTKGWMTHSSSQAIDINDFDGRFYPIHFAAAAGDIVAFDLLRQYGADLNAPSFCNDLCNSSNASQHLIHEHDARMAMSLVHFRKVPGRNVYFWTTLHFALCHGHDSLAKHILSLKGPIREHLMTRLETEEGPLPLFIVAVIHRRLQVADYILSMGIESVHSEYGRKRYGTLLWQAYWKGSEVLEAALPILLKHGANVDADVGQGHTLLIEACSRAHYNEAHALLNAGANSNVRLVKASPYSIMETKDRSLGYSRCRRNSWPRSYRCGLCLGGECYNMSKSSILDMRPIDICVQSFFWYSTALSFGHSEDRITLENGPIVQRLLSLLGPQGVTDSTLLSIAVSTHQSNLVTILLNAGVYFNGRDPSGDSLLRNALNRLNRQTDLSYLPATLLSLAQHAQKNAIKLIDCEWAIFRLIDVKNTWQCITEAIKVLRPCGDINYRDEYQNTALMLAFARRKFHVFNSLVDMGARLGQAQRCQGLPDDDLEFLWEQLLNGESSHDAFRALRNDTIDPERRLLKDPHFKDAATRAGRKDVLTWFHWSNLSQMRWEKHADRRKKRR